MSIVDNNTMPADISMPVGIFDSGVGGLSVLQHIRTALPHEHLLYFADSGYAPYGDKTAAHITERSLAVTAFLVGQGIKALVIACNTATAIAATAIRQAYPDLPIVGIEPGLKPAVKQTKNYIVGVMATHGTITSAKYAALQTTITAESDVTFLSQECVGLADQIEKGELSSLATLQMIERYVAPLIAQGADTLVLGCTHYPFVKEAIATTAWRLGGKPVTIIDTGEPVARQLVRLLDMHHLRLDDSHTGTLSAFTTAGYSSLHHAFTRLLQLDVPITAISDSPKS